MSYCYVRPQLSEMDTPNHMMQTANCALNHLSVMETCDVPSTVLVHR